MRRALLSSFPLIAFVSIAAAQDAPEVRPTLDQIFRHPRVLGTRAEAHSVSADGKFALYTRALTDAEDPERETFVVPTAGGAAVRLFDAESRARAFWSKRGADLFVLRDGWLELHSLDLTGQTAVRPLAEVGANTGEVFQCDDGRRIVFVAGDDAQLYVLDLADGSRRSPAADLVNRSAWFQVIIEQRFAAVFADRTAAAEKPATPGADPSAPAETKPSGAKPDAKPEKAKRVLWIVDLSGATAPRETKFEEGDRVRVLPSGRYALREMFDRSEARQLIMADYLTEKVTTVPVRSSLPGDPAAKVDFDLFDLEAGKPVEVALDAGRRYWTASAALAKDADKILFDRVSDDYHVRQLLLVDPATRSARLIHSERDDAWIGGPTQYAALSADASLVFFTSEARGFNQFYSAACDGTDPTCLTAADAVGEVNSVTRIGDSDRFLVTHNQGDSAAYAIDLIENRTRRTITAQDGVAERPVVSHDGNTIVYRQGFLGVPDELFGARLDSTANPVKLTETFPAELGALGLTPPEIVEYENRADGTKVKAFVYLPPGFDPQRKYPLVVFAHGAGYLQQVTKSLTAYEPNYLFHHRLARRGYVVLDPDYRHSQGYGRKFRTDIYGYMGGKDLDDIVAGIDFLRDRGGVDAERVGIYGGSYGGFLTLMALFTKGDRFAAGCALRSVTDWRTYNAWYTNPRLGDPSRDAENYRRSSPIDHAIGLSKPLLLIHGLKDSNVFAQDTIRLVETLIELQKDDFEMMLYPSQDHGFSDADSWFDEYRRIERFFDRHLAPGKGAH